MYGVDGTNEAVYKLKEEPEKRGWGKKRERENTYGEKEELIKKRERNVKPGGCLLAIPKKLT